MVGIWKSYGNYNKSSVFALLLSVTHSLMDCYHAIDSQVTCTESHLCRSLGRLIGMDCNGTEKAPVSKTFG